MSTNEQRLQGRAERLESEIARRRTTSQIQADAATGANRRATSDDDQDDDDTTPRAPSRGASAAQAAYATRGNR